LDTVIIMLCFLCLFLLQFGLFWLFFQAHLAYFRETKVATLLASVLEQQRCEQSP